MLRKIKMADEDEIDVLGDFSFNSCFAQNNQGIPSCSSREDTVHPQWLLDSTETNWYDKESKRNGPSRRLIGDKTVLNHDLRINTTWSPAERKILAVEMAKYGRNIKKICQAIKTKTEAEVQALIDAEYGIFLEPSDGLYKYNQEDIPTVAQEEVVDNTDIKKVVINPPINVPKHPFRKRNYSKPKQSLLKPNLDKINPEFANPEEIFYDDDMIIGSTESIGSELDMTDVVSKNIAKYQAKVKAEKKIGNHRRKNSRNYDKKPRNSSRELLKSPQGRQRKDSSLSDDSVKSPKMQIVLGSGQALPVSEGEEVIKIEKKKDSEPESDIEIDVDSDNEGSTNKQTTQQTSPKHEHTKTDEPVAVPLRKFEPMPRRQKKINLDGGGGYTIMHTEAGDMYEVGTEPKKERQPKKQPIHLIRCMVYNNEKPAPFVVRMCVSCLILMDAHAHTSRGEVMGLAGGELTRDTLTVRLYSRAAAAAGSTHCDMDPVSQAAAAEALRARGAGVVGWHHSHPAFPSAPSTQDLRSQRALQRALEPPPLAALITSQHWPPGRTASQYRCFRAEDDPASPDTPVGYQLSVQLLADLTPAALPAFLRELRAVLRPAPGDRLAVHLPGDVCPQARLTYLEKLVSSVSQHLRSAGYSAQDPLPALLLQQLREFYS